MHRWAVVSGLVTDEDRLLLVSNRRRNGTIDWSPPGGVIDPGEHELGALSREVAEETGLVVPEWIGPVYEIGVTFETQQMELRVAVYRAAAWTGSIVIDDPDGIVLEAGFHAGHEVTQRLEGSPMWVSDPVLEWLRDPWDGSRAFRYRVGGVYPGDMVVERV